MLFYCSDSYVYINAGKIYALGLADILKRYRDAFGPFRLLVREKPYDPKLPLVEVTDCIAELKTFNSLTQVALPSAALKDEITRMAKESDLLAVRAPSFSGSLLHKAAAKLHRPLLAEVVGCGASAYWHHSLIGKAFAPYSFFKQRQVTRNATYTHYVSERFLQNRYPSGNSVKATVAASDVKINTVSPEVIEKRMDRIKHMDTADITLMTSAAVNVSYKGQEYVIRALPILKSMGINAHYMMAGGGSPDRLSNLAGRLGVSDQVQFLGRLSADDVVANLDRCDIYVQPSLTEGLPRAVVEALSRGCPTVGSDIGGIPELMPSECVVQRKSPRSIANAIRNMLDKGLEHYAQASFERARSFERDVLARKMDDFYESIKKDLK